MFCLGKIGARLGQIGAEVGDALVHFSIKRDPMEGCAAFIRCWRKAKSLGVRVPAALADHGSARDRMATRSWPGISASMYAQRISFASSHVAKNSGESHSRPQQRYWSF